MQPAASKTQPRLLLNHIATADAKPQSSSSRRLRAAGRGSELPRSRSAATREVAAVRHWSIPDLRGLELRVRIQRGRERDSTGDDDAVAGGLDGLELREVVRHGRRRSRGV